MAGDRKLDVEPSIAADDELWVCGTVAEIEDIPAGSAGYRASGCAARRRRHQPPVRGARADPAPDPGLHRHGATWLAAGVASLGYLGWRLLT